MRDRASSPRQAHTAAPVAKPAHFRRRRRSTALINHTAMRRRRRQRGERRRPSSRRHRSSVVNTLRLKALLGRNHAPLPLHAERGPLERATVFLLLFHEEGSTREPRRTVGRKPGRGIRHGALFSLGAVFLSDRRSVPLLCREGGADRVSRRPLRLGILLSCL